MWVVCVCGEGVGGEGKRCRMGSSITREGGVQQREEERGGPAPGGCLAQGRRKGGERKGGSGTGMCLAPREGPARGPGAEPPLLLPWGPSSPSKFWTSLPSAGTPAPSCPPSSSWWRTLPIVNLCNETRKHLVVSKEHLGIWNHPSQYRSGRLHFVDIPGGWIHTTASVEELDLEPTSPLKFFVHISNEFESWNFLGLSSSNFFHLWDWC